MESFFKDSYCGLFCGACEIQGAYRRQLETGKEARWEDLPAAFARYIRKAKVECNGCRSDNVFAGCGGCGIRTCARARKVDFCCECGDYPCDTIRQMASGMEQFGKLLPHAKAIVSNLAGVAELGKDAWLERQEAYWSCPDCGAPRTWYQERCGNCGRDVREAFE